MVDLTTGTSLGGYCLKRLLHQSDDGRRVFLARDEKPLGREVVIKLARLQDEAGSKRLHREFEILRRVEGAHVVEAIGHTVSLPEGIAYLVLAAQGPSLASVLAGVPQQRLTPEMALSTLQSGAVALGELHRSGWGHGDLKPGNLLCDYQGGVVLSDLEFAFPLETRSAGDDEVVMGTPPFIAPELWRMGMTSRSSAADVWALGVTLYLALFGDYPFGHGDSESIQKSIDRGAPARITELPLPLAELLLALLAPEPSDRVADGRLAAAAISRAALTLGLELSTGRRHFAQLVAGLPHSVLEAPPISSTIRRAEPTGGLVATAGKPVPTANTKSPTTKIIPPPGHPKPAPPPPAAGASPGAARPTVGPLEEQVPSPPPGAPLVHPREFFDLASTCGPAPPRAAAPPVPAASMTPKTVPVPLSPPAPEIAKDSAAPTARQVKRRAAARWYRRMNPDRNFPLTVVFSGKQIRIVGGSGLGITLGAQEIVLDPQNPVLNVEPRFPGCLISPPQADVVCSQETATCRFWITPLVCGDLSEACITIRHQGQIVESLRTPTTVVKQTTAKLLAALGLVSPLAGKVLQAAGWNPEDLLKNWLPHATGFVNRLSPVHMGFLLTSLLLAAAAAYYLVTRPLLSDNEPGILADEKATSSA